MKTRNVFLYDECLKDEDNKVDCFKMELERDFKLCEFRKQLFAVK